MPIDELIAKLQKAKELIGGDKEVIHFGSEWELDVKTVFIEQNSKVVLGEGYHDETYKEGLKLI